MITDARPVRLPASLGHAAIIFAVALFLTAPHFLYGYPSGQSAAFNISAQHFFFQQLAAGELYPRWLTDYSTGLGAPVFYYYAPLPFYFASLFGLTGCFNCSAPLLLSISHMALFSLSGITFYFWCSRFTGRTICLVASLVYVLLPYHYLDFEIRNAVGEGMSFVWLPLIFSGLHGVSTSDRISARYIALAAMAYAGLIFTHLPSAVLIIPFMAIYVGVFGTRRSFVRQVTSLAAVGAIGVALSAVYIIPALLMRDYLQPDIWLTQAGTHYMPEYSLLFSGTTSKFGMLVYADSAIATMIALGVVGAMAALNRIDGAPTFPGSDENRRMLVAALISCAVSWLLMNIVSRPIWVIFDILRQVQFPWRLGQEVVFWAASAVAVGLSNIARMTAANKQRWTQFLRPMIYLAVILIPVTAVAAHMIKYRGSLTEGAWAGAMPEVFSVPDEYHSIWAVESTAFKETQSYRDFRAYIATLPQIAVERGQTQDERIMMDRVGPSAFKITAFLAAPAQITARQAFFPTWKLIDIATGADIPIKPSKATGLISAALPAGQSQLKLSVEPARPERIGGAVSAIATFLCLLVLIAPVMRSWRLGQAYANQTSGKIMKTAVRLLPPLFNKRN